MNTARRFAAVLLGAALGLASTTAGATVVYHWTTLSTAQDLQPLGGTLEISNAAWRTGALHYEFAHITGDPEPGDPGSPIIASLFSVSDLEGGAFDVSLDPRTRPGDWRFETNLGFNRSTGLLTGSLYVNNSDSDYTMGSNASGSLWTISAFNTDFDLGQCHQTRVCSGATGFWQLDASTIPVPEPGTLGLSLFGLGLLLSGLALRRRHAL